MKQLLQQQTLICKENHQYSISNLLLLLFSTSFIVWQMGILYFSGTTLSLFGRTPIPLTEQSTTVVIAIGYIASILALCFIPRKAIWMERILLPIAFVATSVMLLPVPAKIITVLFSVVAFVCTFSIGTMASIAAQHFTLETTWRDGILSMVIGGTAIAILQNDFIHINFTAFTLFSLLLIAMQTLFYFMIPAKIEIPYVDRKNTKIPKILFVGIWLISAFSTLLLCFASSYAEHVPNGISTGYFSAAVMAVLLYVIRKKFGTNSIRIFGIFFILAVFGFVLAFLSMHIPLLCRISCVLLGCIIVLANLWIFFAAVAFHVYPTRFIGAIGAGMGLVLAAVHAGLLTLLRDNIVILYGVYAVFSYGLLLIYYFMEPYFAYAWSKKKDTPIPVAVNPFDLLSTREQLLVNFILKGHSETSIAQQMHITLNTQKGYRKNIYVKLGIHSKRELFELAASWSPQEK